ncbi:hypothetical protein CO661_32300 [Sinorhizobium fredii]|uniref:Uncharacterized protein n=1 Tax=Rhizobium fredii TaxID=380 RepID=A0A2A6LMW4_RHIFR|nr:hypothetical protein [Sinorhizobium fredii]PDT43924.1 hypothetical protein CO661_32300 [Sinorhizobium fredii]
MITWRQIAAATKSNLLQWSRNRLNQPIGGSDAQNIDFRFRRPGTAVLPMWWNHSSAYGAESPAFDQFARLDNLISSLPPALENQMSR